MKKKLLLIVALLVFSLTACNSKENIDTAEANTKELTTEATIPETDTTKSIKQDESSKEETESQETTMQTEIETETESQTEEPTTELVTEATLETSIASTEEESSQESQSNEDKTQGTISNITSDEENRAISWSFKRNKDHSPVIGYNEGVDLAKFNSYYIGDTSEKVIYLTFDEGYENGYTPSILDTLKANNVKATFFLTKPFIESEPELSKRIVAEGHIAGNHTVNHPSMPDKTDEELVYEIEENARYFKEVTGYEMGHVLRPPEGKFSARTLDITNKLGYKTIFWSLAYLDWNPDNQPGKEAAYQHVMDNYHNGGIFLLHAVSQSNAEALDDIIKSLKNEGYTFDSLDNLPRYNN